MSKFPENTQFRISENFKNRLKSIIEENDCLSNKQFAELAGVSVPVISKAVNFGIVPSSRMLLKIADKFELSITYLLGLSDSNDFIASATASSFHDRIAALAEERNMNYGQLAAKTTFPRTYIYEWLKEKTLPSIDYVLELSEIFKVSPDYLLGRTDYRE